MYLMIYLFYQRRREKWKHYTRNCWYTYALQEHSIHKNMFASYLPTSYVHKKPWFFLFWKKKCLCQLLKLTIIRNNVENNNIFDYSLMFSAKCIPSIHSNLNTRAHCYNVYVLNKSTRVMMVWVYMENYKS